MDLSQAVLPGILVFAIIAAITQATGGRLPSSVKVPLAFVLGIAAVVAVAASDFGHTQVVADKALDTLNGASQVIVGLLVGSVAVGIDVAQKAVRNIGQNDNTPVS
jgi:uncharacterized membrane protein AbrB (regulator of aidB expression)